MKIIYAILGVLLYGGAAAQLPKVYAKHYEGDRLGITVVYEKLKPAAPDTAKKFLLITGIRFTACNERGTPKKSFVETLTSIDAAVQQQINLLGTGVKAGTFTYNCSQLGYYYLSDTADVRAVLETFYKQNFPEYGSHIYLRPDPQWEAYLKYLYPDESRGAVLPPLR
ncbi:DUF695 domain-containing protein [Chitinophaga lutea]|uniref:DUF695 domain-containing protein n=1 Tax=Chitinophaga lutea TaxID=2488634 RepID=A0A3N4PAC7_9BACT|nr:DUF695 domain-containing protein [Chitinophaga lutea]RPE05602.1 DUF695 domain-containing protein [Chitinophaga lutea]